MRGRPFPDLAETWTISDDGLVDIFTLRQRLFWQDGAPLTPDDVIFTADLPKTRSGKIMRRLLRDIAEGKAVGDTTTLADPNVIARLKEQYQEDH